MSTIRFTLVALEHELSTFKVPFIDGSTNVDCNFYCNKTLVKSNETRLGYNVAIIIIIAVIPFGLYPSAQIKSMTHESYYYNFNVLYVVEKSKLNVGKLRTIIVDLRHKKLLSLRYYLPSLTGFVYKLLLRFQQKTILVNLLNTLCNPFYLDIYEMYL